MSCSCLSTACTSSCNSQRNSSSCGDRPAVERPGPRPPPAGPARPAPHQHRPLRRRRCHHGRHRRRSLPSDRRGCSVRLAPEPCRRLAAPGARHAPARNPESAGDLPRRLAPNTAALRALASASAAVHPPGSAAALVRPSSALIGRPALGALGDWPGGMARSRRTRLLATGSAGSRRVSSLAQFVPEGQLYSPEWCSVIGYTDHPTKVWLCCKRFYFACSSFVNFSNHVFYLNIITIYSEGANIR